MKFYATWCGPCRMMAPLAERIASEYDMPLVSVDIDAEPDVATKYGVDAVPTLLVVEDEEEISRWIGMNTKARITSGLGL